MIAHALEKDNWSSRWLTKSTKSTKLLHGLIRSSLQVLCLDTTCASSRLVSNSRVGEEPLLMFLDGGGVRGLSSLLILRRLMYTIEATDDLHRVPKPCEHFDMMCGTSTGG